MNERWIIAAGIFFSLFNVVFIITENFWGLLFPFGLALIASVVLALDKVLLFLVFSTPLSIFYFNPDFHVGFSLPTEPILFGIMILFFIKLLYEGDFDPKVLRHPLSLLMLFNLFWLFFTSISSQIPFVSFKYFLARLWFITVFFYLFSQLFKKPGNIKLFFWLFMIPLSMTAIYTIYRHSLYDFTKSSSVWVMSPFFKEHTSYAAVIVMYIPISFAFAFILKHNLNQKLFSTVLFLVLTLALILSFSRAAWISVVVAAGAIIPIILKMRRDILALLIVVFSIGIWVVKDDFLKRLKKNDHVSSDNLTEHLESISNISTDISNLERINRWKSALRMFSEKPILGFGPGTYMFLYAPYQKPHEKTIISTNAGDIGNAHSEYIGSLAESGLIGLLSVIAIVVVTIITGIRAYRNANDYNIKIIALTTLAGLITYWTHGLLNNFLEIDKAACPVFSFSALLVVIDSYYLRKKAPLRKSNDKAH